MQRSSEEDQEASDYYDSDEFCSDDEEASVCDECDEECWFFEATDWEIDFNSGLPFWLLDAEEELIAAGPAGTSLGAAATSSEPAEGWVLWLAEAERILGSPPEATPNAEALPTKSLKRSGSFERRRKAFNNNVATATKGEAAAKGDAVPQEEAAKEEAVKGATTIRRSGSFERRRKALSDRVQSDQANGTPKALIRSGSFERRRKMFSAREEGNPAPAGQEGVAASEDLVELQACGALAGTRLIEQQQSLLVAG